MSTACPTAIARDIARRLLPRASDWWQAAPANRADHQGTPDAVHDARVTATRDAVDLLRRADPALREGLKQSETSATVHTDKATIRIYSGEIGTI